MRWRASLLVVLGACNFPLPSSMTDIDAGPDAPPISTCTPWTPFISVNPCDAAIWPPKHVEIIGAEDGVLDSNTGTLTVGLSVVTLPTMELTRPATGDGTIRVFNLSRLAVNSGRTLTITGTRAVMLLVHSSVVTIDGVIEASAVGAPLANSPGGNPSRCTSVGGAGVSATDDTGAGGGGGAYGGAGASGGDAAGVGAAGGQGDAASLVWRGGCNGGVGGTIAGQNGGGPGVGGGALAISARGALTISGMAELRANGSPGKGAGPGAGGGGGGAGGGIALDAVTLSMNGKLCANGGGGGGGGGNAVAGNPGGAVTCTAIPSSGGSGGGTEGGRGGAGAAGGTPAAGGLNRASNGGGGGGGGGGAGKILLRSRNGQAPTINGSAVVSPSHQLL